VPPSPPIYPPPPAPPALPPIPPPCEKKGSYVTVRMLQSNLDRNDLGGLDAANGTTDAGMYVRNVGNNTIDPAYESEYGKGTNKLFDLRITNVTKYLNPLPASQNRLVQACYDDDDEKHEGCYAAGVFNIGAPRKLTPNASIGLSNNEVATFVELMFEFVDVDSGSPVTVPHTFMSLNDLQAALMDEAGTPQGMKLVQPLINAESKIILPDADKSELISYSSWADAIQANGTLPLSTSDAILKAFTLLPHGDSPIFGGTKSHHDDEDEERHDTLENRMVMLELIKTSQFKVRFAVTGCCAESRAFEFTGVLPEQCEAMAWRAEQALKSPLLKLADTVEETLPSWLITILVTLFAILVVGAGYALARRTWREAEEAKEKNAYSKAL